MTTISTAHDYIHTKLATVFSSHKRVANPYKIDENPSRILEQSYGVAMGSAINTNLEMQCRFSVQRNIRITLTRKFFSLENDPAQKATTVKTLLEDHYSLVNAFEGDTTLGDSVIRFSYVSDGGVEFVFDDKDQYLFIATDFTLDYIEQII